MNKTKKKSDKIVADRRVQKTRKLLSDALVSLVVEKGFDAVSIQDIIDRANVGRSTFYAHYENKEQLLLFGHEHLRNLARQEGQDAVDFVSFYRHLDERRHLAVKLLAEDRATQLVTRSLHDTLLHGISRFHPCPSGNEHRSTVHALLTQAAAAALVQMTTSWIRLGSPLTAEEMARQSTSLLERMLRFE